MQNVALDCALKKPAAQGAHVLEFRYWPAGQLAMPVEPSTVKKPGGANAHADAPAMLLYWPAAQASHAEVVALRNCPAGQPTQFALEWWSSKVPGGHDVHEVEDAGENCDAGQG